MKAWRLGQWGSIRCFELAAKRLANHMRLKLTLGGVILTENQYLKSCKY